MSVFGKSLLIAQANRLFRPATRRTEWEQRFEQMGTVCSQSCSRDFLSASRRPGRASRPRHPFIKRALSEALPDRDCVRRTSRSAWESQGASEIQAASLRLVLRTQPRSGARAARSPNEGPHAANPGL
jgi:hypothetical protein